MKGVFHGYVFNGFSRFMRQAPYVLLPASVGECRVSIQWAAALGRSIPSADVNDLLSMSDCAMLWGIGEISLSNSLKLGTITQFITLDEHLARPQSTIHFLWTDRSDLDHLLANRRLLGLLVGQDQVRVEQLERGELCAHYC